MSIKRKSSCVPPEEDDFPPYAKDMLCWGCGKLFDCMELRVETELCYKCHAIVTPGGCGLYFDGTPRVRCDRSRGHKGLHCARHPDGGSTISWGFCLPSEVDL